MDAGNATSTLQAARLLVTSNLRKAERDIVMRSNVNRSRWQLQSKHFAALHKGDVAPLFAMHADAAEKSENYGLFLVHFGSFW